MGNGARRVIFTGILTAAAISGAVPAAAQEEYARLHLAAVNHAGVPEDVWQRAQATASRIYQAARINVIWINSAATASTSTVRSDLTIIVSAVPTASRLPSSKDVLGYAVDPLYRGRIAYAFYERIQHFARKVAIDVGVLLGHVMAHETGHLLLAKKAHSLVGLMQARWEAPQTELLSTETLTFTNDEAAVIRTRVADFSNVD